MTREELRAFMAQHRYAVEATVDARGRPQAAVIGIAVTEQLEIVFDTLGDTRKHANLRRSPRIALVVGWEDSQTAQVEGVADFPEGGELKRLQQAYFAAHPDGPTRLGWPGISYVRVKLDWARYSDFRKEPARVIEVPL